MKLYTVIDIPDDDYKMSDHWIIDTDRCVKFLSENGFWIPYKLHPYGYELKQLPEKLIPFGYLDMGNEDGLYEKGYNDCIDRIAGED